MEMIYSKLTTAETRVPKIKKALVKVNHLTKAQLMK
jgi:hypothetical protein